jgi:hypothetical protein
MFAVLRKSRQAIFGGMRGVGEDVGSRAPVFAAIALLLFPGEEMVVGEIFWGCERESDCTDDFPIVRVPWSSSMQPLSGGEWLFQGM